MSSFSEVFKNSSRKRKKQLPLSIFDKSEAYVRSFSPALFPPSKKCRQRPPVEEPVITDQGDRTLFVGNLSLSIKKLPKKVSALFKKFGEVESVRIRSVPSSKGDNAPKRVIAQNRRFEENAFCNAYLVFKNASSVTEALSLNMTMFHGFHIRVDKAGEKGFQQPWNKRESLPGKFSPNKSIFVRNISKEVSDEDLMKLFNDGALVPLCKGMVKNWRIVHDHKTGLSKGYGFISFLNSAAAKASFALDGYTLKDAPISIEKLTLPGSKVDTRSKGVRKRATTWGGIQTKGRFKSRTVRR